MAREEDMLLFRIEDGVGIITLNRPHKLNAISWDLAEELSRLLYLLRDDDAVRCGAAPRRRARLLRRRRPGVHIR